MDPNNKDLFMTILNQLILSNFESDAFSLQFEEIFSTPFKFFLFLKKFKNWKNVFSNINFFSFNHLPLSRIERTKYLGAGLSGQVMEYEGYAVKTFYFDRVAEFRREILTYGIIQNVVPTLRMVLYDLNQHTLVLYPVASRTYKNSGIQPALQFYENLVDDLEKLHHFGLVHRDIRPDNLIYIPYGSSGERLIMIDWSSSMFENITASFEGTVRYASDNVLLQLISQNAEISYKHQDDLCSLVKVFLGEILSVDKNLISLNNEKNIFSLAADVFKIWDHVKKNNFLVKYFLEAAETENYEMIKKFMKGLYHGLSFDMVFVFLPILLFLLFNLYN
jgi:serine/threonine protein kinase